ncbi:hypothetical protein pmac_cds_620 [Pandoravirus macleodensis]|uniref:Uncharacterized protein n=1 Tax=Pandoravirus macleodensis TaxID=2107707 RepID=A0A2U7UFN8_9VIRU|nr:hypothetical protein pmac_cds_620 [Pandoravirus macleodensis]AVK77308.1 hypothetical protein pmac_cds_620 [Pandoravirus macleodensis]UMO80058.1 hypothetical protein [Pandoravirus aubagnensis]
MQSNAAITREAGVLHADMITDDFDGEHYICSFVLKYKSCDGAIRMSFSVDPSTTEPDDWVRLLSDMRRGVESQIDTCPSNGEVSITHRNGSVTFVTSKYGSGGDGDMHVTLPAADCVAAIERCATMFADHVASGGD